MIHLHQKIGLSLPILDTLQKNVFLLVNVDIPINTKRLVRINTYPCKIDLDIITHRIHGAGIYANMNGVY